MKYTIGQRVNTKYGAGTIAKFEHIESVNLPATYTETYQDGDRIGVNLDRPENWFLSVLGAEMPFFMPGDLSDYVINL